ncbi:MAG TPA: 4'-phosphopantetheinyl transferase superfamily protein [Mucilaginibacter sp.]|jgi:4'-phosphopantetheinyl transferase|nr:4'-phosphopantetheinyl transferase superfamily protein [Mucilaginibacter sp.]
MIVGYHTQIKKDWTDDDLHHKLSLLPQFLQDKILCKHQHLGIQLSVAGNLLLLKLIDHFKLNLRLDNLQYGQHQRPYFDGGFDFNISHSGNRIICCGTIDSKIGVDIELMKPTGVDYDDYFTNTEQQNIRAAKNPKTEFFKYWTRKEAVLKAIGTGVCAPLLDIDVSDDEVVYQNETFHLMPIEINDDFAGYVACDVKQGVLIKKVEV